MSSLIKLNLRQMHPGVAEMDAIYQFSCEYNGKVYFDNSGDTMFMLSADSDEVRVNGLDVIVPYSFRQAKKTVRITAQLCDYYKKITDQAYYDLSFLTAFSDETTFFDDFEEFDKNKWRSGNEAWEYGEMPEPVIEGSDIVFEATSYEQPFRLISTAHSFKQAFGCFSARLKMPDYKNTECTCNMAFWLCSNVFEPEKIMFKRNPQVKEAFGRSHAGEIDIVEYSGAFGDFSALSYHHFGWGKYHISSGLCAPTPGVREGYHIFSLVWVPDALFWYYDGHLIRVIDDETIKDAGKEPGGEMVVILQSGFSKPTHEFPSEENKNILCTWTGMSNPNDFPMQFRADWVKVHALK